MPVGVSLRQAHKYPDSAVWSLSFTAAGWGAGRGLDRLWRGALVGLSEERSLRTRSLDVVEQSEGQEGLVSRLQLNLDALLGSFVLVTLQAQLELSLVVTLGRVQEPTRLV